MSKPEPLWITPRRPMSSAPKDRLILTWSPPSDGLPALWSLCQWHPDAGFCVDELRTPALWWDLPEAPLTCTSCGAYIAPRILYFLTADGRHFIHARCYYSKYFGPTGKDPRE